MDQLADFKKIQVVALHRQDVKLKAATLHVKCKEIFRFRIDHYLYVVYLLLNNSYAGQAKDRLYYLFKVQSPLVLKSLYYDLGCLALAIQLSLKIVEMTSIRYRSNVVIVFRS